MANMQSKICFIGTWYTRCHDRKRLVSQSSGRLQNIIEGMLRRRDANGVWRLRW